MNKWGGGLIFSFNPKIEKQLQKPLGHFNIISHDKTDQAKHRTKHNPVAARAYFPPP